MSLYRLSLIPSSSKSRYARLLATLLSVAFSSCGDADFSFQTPSKLVIEGYAEAGGCPTVFLTSSVQVSSHYVSIDSLSTHLLRHADVVLYDGDEKFYLTGHYRQGSYAFPFEYTTGCVVCQPGHTYRIEVDYDGMHAQSSATVPTRKCHLKEVRPVVVSDTLFKIVAIPEEGEELSQARFFVNYRYTGGDFMLAQTMVGIDGSMEIFRPILQGVDLSHNYFQNGDEVIVRCSTFDPVGLRFWDSYQELLALSRLILLPVADNIDSNIQGGLGGWFGCQSDYYVVN